MKKKSSEMQARIDILLKENKNKDDVIKKQKDEFTSSVNYY
jgi:hypothetical protein